MIQRISRIVLFPVYLLYHAAWLLFMPAYGLFVVPILFACCAIDGTLDNPGGWRKPFDALWECAIMPWEMWNDPL